MKKILAVTLSTLMILATATGCLKRVDPNSASDAVIGGNSGDEIDNIINPDKDMEGKLKIAVPNVDSHIDAIEAFVSSYNEKFPNIDVEIVKFDLDQYKGKVKDFAAAAQAVNRPQDMFDVFWLPQDYINEWYSLRLVGSLDALIEKDPDVSKDMLISNAVESSSVNGSLYMMPRDYNQVVMYYNKKMFDDVGMDYPTSKMSADDFKEMIVELRERLCTSNKTNDYGVKYKEGISCIIDCNIKWDSLAWPLLKSFGGTIVNEQGEVTFDSEENLNAFKYWKSLTENEDYACPLAISVEKGGTNPGIQFRMQQAPLFSVARGGGRYRNQHDDGRTDLLRHHRPRRRGTAAVRPRLYHRRRVQRLCRLQRGCQCNGGLAVCQARRQHRGAERLFGNGRLRPRAQGSAGGQKRRMAQIAARRF